MTRAPLLALAAVAVALGGCGGGGQAPTTKATAPPATRRAPADPTQPPANVPQKATGPADAPSAQVIRAWSKTLRRGDVRRAAGYFSLPSKFQNGTPVLTIDIPPERVAINAALACGAVPVKLGSAGPFTIVTFRLVERVGGNCGAGTGGRARTAIRVSAGRIREWYRLPDKPAPGTATPSDPGPIV